eukprot:TRINITY_DN759_c0_g1_i1.p1 TRINITY_DN759_c0_g1~~TRINITY_DN759_c0_g1_i1.p1  ORF type:complete len:289 (+),score=7.69 TRINITY_DN759_c0_g1_i1:116-982(+)
MLLNPYDYHQYSTSQKVLVSFFWLIFFAPFLSYFVFVNLLIVFLPIAFIWNVSDQRAPLLYYLFVLVFQVASALNITCDVYFAAKAIQVLTNYDEDLPFLLPRVLILFVGTILEPIIIYLVLKLSEPDKPSQGKGSSSTVIVSGQGQGFAVGVLLIVILWQGALALARLWCMYYLIRELIKNGLKLPAECKREFKETLNIIDVIVLLNLMTVSIPMGVVSIYELLTQPLVWDQFSIFCIIKVTCLGVELVNVCYLWFYVIIWGGDVHDPPSIDNAPLLDPSYAPINTY